MGVAKHPPGVARAAVAEEIGLGSWTTKSKKRGKVVVKVAVGTKDQYPTAVSATAAAAAACAIVAAAASAEDAAMHAAAMANHLRETTALLSRIVIDGQPGMKPLPPSSTGVLFHIRVFEGIIEYCGELLESDDQSQ